MGGRHSKERESQGVDSEEQSEDQRASLPVWRNSRFVDRICGEARLAFVALFLPSLPFFLESCVFVCLHECMLHVCGCHRGFGSPGAGVYRLL